MKLYLIENLENLKNFDFISAVVVASSEKEARLVYPGFDEEYFNTTFANTPRKNWPIIPELIKVTYIGAAKETLNEKDIICCHRYYQD